MSSTSVWWAADCPKCGGRRLLEGRQPGEKRFTGPTTTECANCRAPIVLNEVAVYLYDRQSGTRVAH